MWGGGGGLTSSTTTKTDGAACEHARLITTRVRSAESEPLSCSSPDLARRQCTRPLLVH